MGFRKTSALFTAITLVLSLGLSGCHNVIKNVDKPNNESTSVITSPSTSPSSLLASSSATVSVQNSAPDTTVAVNSAQSNSEPTVENDLNGWIGEYIFDESAPPDQVWHYDINISNVDGSYYAEIDIDGFQTEVRIKALVSGTRNLIDLIFNENLPDNDFPRFNVGDKLLSFNRNDTDILTYWGALQPNIIDNQATGKVYFIQTKAVSTIVPSPAVSPSPVATPTPAPTLDSADTNRAAGVSANILVKPAFAYENVLPFAGNRAVAETADNQYYIVNQTGKQLLRLPYESVNSNLGSDLISVGQGGKYGLINRQGKLIIPAAYGCISVNNGLVSVEQNEKWGLIDTTGKIIMPCDYTYEQFTNLLTAKNGWLDIVDNKGNLITPYTSINYVGDYCILAKNKLYGMVDKNGKTVIPFQYTVLDYDSVSGLVSVILANGAQECVNVSSGKVVAPAGENGYELVSDGEGASSKTYILVKKWNGSQTVSGLLDETGKQIIPCVYLYLSDLSIGGGMAAVEDFSGKIGYYDLTTGKLVIPCKYDAIFTGNMGDVFCSCFSDDGLATVSLNGKGGVIDKKGDVVIPFTYHGNLSDLGDGYFQATASDGQGYIINTAGKKITPVDADGTYGYYFGGSSFYNTDVTQFQLNKHFGLLYKSGAVILPAVYDAIITPDTSTSQYGWIEQDGKYGIFEIVS